MNDTTSDFTAYLMPDEHVIWQGRNAKVKHDSLLKRLAPVMLGMILALAIAYYIVLVVSPGYVLYIGFGLDTKTSVFLIVLLLFMPFLIRSLLRGYAAKSTMLFGVKIPIIPTLLILASLTLLVLLLWQGMPLSLAVLLVLPSLIMVTFEDPQRDQYADYLITDQSLLIVPTGNASGKRVSIVPFKSLAGIEVTENRDGTGTLIFGTRPEVTNRTRAGSLLAFWNIEQPWDVYQLIRKQIDESANR